MKEPTRCESSLVRSKRTSLILQYTPCTSTRFESITCCTSDRTHRIRWRNSSRNSSCPSAHVSLCVILSDQQPIIMCQCHETLFVMWCCRLLPWRRGSSKVRVYTLSIIMRLTGTIFTFLQCLKFVCFMFHQAVVAVALITLIFWSSSSAAAAAAPVGPKTGHAWNLNCQPICCITLKKIMWTMKSWWVHGLQLLPWSDLHLPWGWPPKWSI